LNHRTLAADFETDLTTHTVLLQSGLKEVNATLAVLKSGIVKTIIVNAATALLNCYTFCYINGNAIKTIYL